MTAVDPRIAEALAAYAVLHGSGWQPNRRQDSRICEYFTGAGLLTRWLSFLGRVESVDVKRRRFPAAGVTFVQSDALRHARQIGNCDLVVAHGGLHHLPEPSQRQLVQELLRDSQWRRRSVLLMDVVPPGTEIASEEFWPYSVPIHCVPRAVQTELRHFIGRRADPSVLQVTRHSIAYVARRDGRSSADILEEYVHAYRDGGHVGVYRGLQDWRAWVEAAGGTVERQGYLDVPWIFESADEVAAFTREFFELRRTARFVLDEWKNKGWLRSRTSIEIPWTVQFLLAS